MDVKKQIKSLLSQADIYKSQGLLREARDKFLQAGKLIKENDNIIRNAKSLLVALGKKIKLLDEDFQRLKDSENIEVSEQVQEIIKKKFAFSKEGDDADLEGALALAKFGQYERALEEFRNLLNRDAVKLEAAKNIFRCHAALDSERDAVKSFQQWFSGDFFDADQLDKLRIILEDILQKKGLDIPLPGAKVPESQEAVPEDEREEEEIDETEFESPDVAIDISSVGITITSGPNQGRTQEYDVSFQSGNVINLMISNKDKAMLDFLEPGKIIEQVQYFSPIAMFDGKASVVSKMVIEAGPKQGNYTVDMKILSV